MSRRATVRGLLATALTGAVLVAPVLPAATASAPSTAEASAHAAPGTQTMTWTQIHDRMMTWVGNQAITYSQSGTYPGPGGTRYRRDCSGFVSMALGLPSSGGGPNTVTMTKYVHRISYSDLHAGDLLGHLGEGSEGDNGHVRIFINWANEEHTQVRVAEQGWVSNPDYPHISVQPRHTYLDSGAELLPYRYNHKA